MQKNVVFLSNLIVKLEKHNNSCQENHGARLIEKNVLKSTANVKITNILIAVYFNLISYSKGNQFLHLKLINI